MREIFFYLGQPEIANHEKAPSRYTFLSALAGRTPERAPNARWTVAAQSPPRSIVPSDMLRPSGIVSLVIGLVLGSAGVHLAGEVARSGSPEVPPPNEAIVRHEFKVNGSAIGAAFGPQNTLAVATASGNITLLNLKNENKRVELGRTGAFPAARAVFNPRGNALAVGSVDGTVRIWENALTSPYEAQVTLPMQEDGKYAGAVIDMAYSPNGKYLVVASSTSLIRIWDVSNPSHPTALASSSQPHLVTRLAFNASGDMLAVGNTDSTVQLWDVKDPRNPRDLYGEIKAPTGVTALAFSSGRKTLAVGSSNGSVQLWDVSNPEDPSKTADARAVGYTNDLAFNGDGYTLAASNTNGTVRLWEDLDSLAEPRVFKRSDQQGELSSVTFGDSRNTLAVTGTDGSVQLWAT
ncbi:hypothetical protein ABZX77_17780 [Streptomyces sp. NPDC004237]|uniref:WD40 repeat domain-containing protein n=1 Tax=Streptomyces sp. NPDC004237 TaxID=3154455 RepID=UPI0033B8D95F